MRFRKVTRIAMLSNHFYNHCLHIKLGGSKDYTLQETVNLVMYRKQKRDYVCRPPASGRHWRWQ